MGMLSALEKVQLLQKLTDATVPGLSPLSLSLKDVDSLLSHGEKQPLCLTRAILSPGRVVVLDEASSGVDGVTDALMQKVLRKTFRDGTIIVIAHNLNSSLDFSRIVGMDTGQIADMGEHSALMKKENGRFRALGEQQMHSGLFRLAMQDEYL